MKGRLRKILFLVLLILIVQISGFMLLERQADWLLNPSFRFDHTYRLPVSLEGAHSFQLSYNNKFLAYIQDQKLMVIDLMKKEPLYNSNNVQPVSKVLGFQWLPDRNSLLFLMKNNQQNTSITTLYSVDLDVQSLNELETRMNREISMPIESVVKIDMSTYTNNLFFTVIDGKGVTNGKNNLRYSVLKMDIMKTINYLSIPNEQITRLAVSNKFGTVYLESHDVHYQRRIRAYTTGQIKTISSHSDHILLGSYHDQVYIGRIEDQTLVEILLYDEKKPNTFTTIWTGEIPYDSSNQALCLENKIILQGTDRIDNILISGTHHTIQLNPYDNVLSPTGKMFLEIRAFSNKTEFSWKPIEMM